MGFIVILRIVFCAVWIIHANGEDNNFSKYYSYLWGTDHFSVNPQGTEVQLKMDKSSGAGFRSKLDYGSGLFHIRMKIPERKTGGIVTSFYLTEVPDNGQDPGNHFEVDYEFLGTNGTVQTNVYDDDTGHREQSFNFGFDPSKDFHTYEILWNAHQILFMVDKIPIRVFKNNTARGVAYPSKSMHVEASIWNADWAGVVDWSQAPFIAHYQDFSFNACSAPPQSPQILNCSSQHYFWNKPQYSQLSPDQKRQMEQYRKSYMIYDYCSNKSTFKPECSLNN